MSRVLFSVWFTIQGIIQNTTCSVWFRIQRIIKKCPGYYSASGSGFSVWFRIQRIIKNCPGYYLASGSVFSILFKIAQVIIQRLVQDSAYSRSQISLKYLGSPEDVPARPVWAQWCVSSREVPGVQNRPEVTTPKMIKFAFYSKMN